MQYILSFFLEDNTSGVEDLFLESQSPFGAISVGDTILPSNFAKIEHELDPMATYQVTRVEHQFRDCHSEDSDEWEVEHAINVYLRPISK